MSEIPNAFAELEQAVGTVWRAGADGYDEARDAVSWNKRLHTARTPDAIVQVDSAAQVASLIGFARTHQRKLSVRGSGHNYQAAALRDGGLLIDLAGLDRIEVDAAAQAARVGAGVKGGALIETLAKHGLAFPIGHCADVALSGYLLSGGFGWNYGEWGPACVSVTAVELVTATGEIIRASADHHQELFWAARGAGPGFFAVVTGYELKLHPLPAAAYAFTASFTPASAADLAEWLTESTRAAHPSVEVICLVGPDPHAHQPSITIKAVSVGASAAEARERVGPLRDPPARAEPIGEPDEQLLDFADITKLMVMPAGKRVAGDHLWAGASIGEMLLAVQHLADIPRSFSSISLIALGGSGWAPALPEGWGCALSRGGGPAAGIYAMWDEEADDARHLEWVRSVNAALEPLRIGRYVGEADLAAEPTRLAECFSPEALQRLDLLKQRYDPEDLFFSYATDL